MKFKIFFIGVALLGLVSCGSDKVEVVDTKVHSAESKMVANIGIENMTCVMGCGSTIKGALAKLDGVLQTNFDFEDGRDINRALVEFDPAKVSVDEMISAITSVHDGAYGVTDAIKEEHFVESVD